MAEATEGNFFIASSGENKTLHVSIIIFHIRMDCHVPICEDIMGIGGSTDVFIANFPKAVVKKNPFQKKQMKVR